MPASSSAKETDMRKKLTKKQQRATIAHEYRDSDGYWIELLPGWQNGYDPGTHGIVEDTKTAAYSTLTGVEACDCKECHELKGAK